MIDAAFRAFGHNHTSSKERWGEQRYKANLRALNAFLHLLNSELNSYKYSIKDLQFQSKRLKPLKPEAIPLGF